MSLYERPYALAIRCLLPADFRRDFAVHMQRTFRDQLAHRASWRGRLAALASACGDLLQVFWRLRRDRRHRLAFPTSEPTIVNILQDLRYAVRALTSAPGFTAIAVLTLALGIGANALIFSLVDTVLLRPLPLPESERLVNVWESNLSNGWPRFSVSPLNFLDMKEQAESFEAFSGMYGTSATLTDDGDPERISGVRVSGDFFELVGARPALGRAFVAGDHREGNTDVVILGPELWARRFGSDPGVVGSTIVLNGRATEVVGVITDQQAKLPSSAEFWLPIDLDGARQVSRGAHYWRAMGRLAPGVELAAADEEVRRIADRLPDAERGWSALATDLHEDVVGGVRSSLQLLLGAVALVLLIACVNVANLFLVRAESRTRELALRSALGAGRTSLVRQVLVEALLIAAAGVALALPAAYLGLELIRDAAADVVPRLGEVSIDARVAVFSAVVATFTALGFGLVPALRAARLDPVDNLKEGERGARGRSAGRARAGLVIAEVALAVLVVVTAGLLARSLWELNSVDPGFETDARLTARLSLPSASYEDDAQVIGFYDRLLESLRADPGVVAATAASNLPMTGDFSTGFSIEGDTGDDGNRNAELRVVDPSYFDVLGVPLLQGRAFAPTDDRDAEEVVVVNRAFAETFFPDGNLLGTRLNIGYNQLSSEEGGPILRRVVGVVDNVREFGLANDTPPTYYASRRQQPPRSLTLVVHSEARAADIVPVMRARLAELDPDLPLHSIATLGEVVAGTTASRRFRLNLVASFAALALVLAALGIYGTVAYGMSRRTHEIGVRMAIGARPRDVVRLVLRTGLLPVFAGVGLGIAGAVAAGRLLESMLYEVRPGDPVTIAGVVVVLLAVAVAACWLPARRAMRLSPVTALRAD